MNWSRDEYEDALMYVQDRCAELVEKEGKKLSESLVLRAFADYCGIQGYVLTKDTSQRPPNIGTELQEFQKWLAYCDFTEVAASGVGGDMRPRIYSVGSIDDDVIYCLNPTAGHATAIIVAFENGYFHHCEGLE